MARRRDIKLVDLCKINTDRFRHMTQEQLKRAGQTIAPYGAFNKAERDKAYLFLYPTAKPTTKLPERRSRTINFLIGHFIGGLHRSREPEQKLRPDIEAKLQEDWQKQYNKPYPSDAQIRAGNKRDAERAEKAIWDLQARAGCAIKGEEQVARDAVRENKPDAAARIRRKPIIR